ncbi:DMT family transporter [Rhodovibrionaceae bacterium A322]
MIDSERTKIRWALMAAAATGVQVGAAMVASRYVIAEIPPASLALLRYVIALLFLLPFLPYRAWPRMPLKDLAVVMLLGMLQFGLLIFLLNFGLRFIASGQAALLFATFPLMTMVVAAAFGREALGWAKSLGVMLSILGVGAVVHSDLLSGVSLTAHPQGWLGVLAVLGAALTGAVCSVFYGPYLNRYATLPLAFLAMAGSILALGLAAWTEGFFAHPIMLSAPGWGAVLFIGASSGIGYLLWLYALAHASPTKVTIFLSLSPLTAAVLGVLLLGESFTVALAFGLLGVVSGLWVATRVSGNSEQKGQSTGGKPGLERRADKG